MTDDKAKRPASQYYWANWLSDTMLQTCSLPARGMWHEMNCLMHQCEPYGHLYRNGKPMQPAQIANLVRVSESICKKLLAELEDAGVFSRDAQGAIFSRRMVRDEAAREARAAGGHAGGEHGHKGAKDGFKGGRPKEGKGGEITPLDLASKPPPSSSSASSPAGLNTSSPNGLVPPDESAGPEDGDAKKPGLPDCPHQKIRDLWALLLPAMPQHTEWTEARQTLLRTRWRQKAAELKWANEEDGLKFFAQLFRYVGTSKFLTGQVKTRDGQPPFLVTLAWLLIANNFAKTVEGNYHTEA